MNADPARTVRPQRGCLATDMRVLVVQPFSQAPGPSLFAEQFCESLCAEGHEAGLVTPGPLVTLGGRQVPWKQYAGSNSTVAACQGISGNYISRRLGTLRANWSAISGALRISRKEGYDIVHVLDAELLTLIAANLWHRRPHNLVVTYRGYEFGTGSSPLPTRLFQAARRLAWRLTAKNVHLDCETEEVKSRLESTGAVRSGSVRVIPHPIWSSGDSTHASRLEARRRLGLPETAPVFLIFGHRPRGQKAIDVAIEAVRPLERNFLLLIAGKEADASADAELDRQIKAAEWDDSVVRRYKFIPNSEVPDYFAASDALILSYRRSYEGASGVLAQACAFETPVIASDAGDLGRMVREWGLGLVFATEDAASLREAIRSFLKLRGAELAAMKASLARARAERSWSRVICQHIAMYEDVLRGPV